MSKLKRCRVRGCPHVAFYQGYCRQCLNPLIDQAQSKPLRFKPQMEQATEEPEETRKRPDNPVVPSGHGGRLTSFGPSR